MNDNQTDMGPLAPEASPEPPSSPAPAQPRGPSLWNRLRTLLSLRTVSLRDDLQVALEEQGSAEIADFSESERTILQNVLKLGDKRVDDVMVERSDIQAVPADITLGGLIARFRAAGHSRLPVFTDGLDDISGFIHVKDALNLITASQPVVDPAKDQPVKLVPTALRQKITRLDLIRPAVYVPGSMPVGDLLQSMRASRVHMAIVVDEYGGTDGLVTIEDLLEAVVGEIEDEHDEFEKALVRRVAPDIYIADARAELEEIREIVGADFDTSDLDADVDTLGGLVFDLFGHLPARGETIHWDRGFTFEVLGADGRRITKVRIRRPAPQVAPAPEQAAAE